MTEKRDENGKSEFGVLYVLDGKPGYERMLKLSLESLDAFHPDWPRHVVRVPLPEAPFPAKVRRLCSFWRWKKILNRFGQNSRFYRAKASALLDSPFKHTLFMDVDTVVRRSLEPVREKALRCDAVFTALPWKQYPRLSPDLPERIPFVMSGVFFYNQRYAELCRPYLDRFGDRLHESVDGLTIGDQFIFSLVCASEKDRLDIRFDPHLQIDVVNGRQHLGTDQLEMEGKCIDLRWEALEKFHVFHYNEYKPQYLRLIKDVWGLPRQD